MFLIGQVISLTIPTIIIFLDFNETADLFECYFNFGNFNKERKLP